MLSPVGYKKLGDRNILKKQDSVYKVAVVCAGAYSPPGAFAYGSTLAATCIQKARAFPGITP